jgi:tight adherence protein C
MAAFVAAFAAVAWIMGARGQRAEARISDLARRRTASLDASFGQRVVTPVVGGFGRTVIDLLPGAFYERIDRDLDAAGWPMRPAQFVFVVAGVSLFLGALPIVVPLLGGGGIELIGILMGVLLAVFGALTAIFLLRRAIAARRQAIWRSLPDACDLLTLSVEAGLGLDAALRLVSQKLHGPLAEEIGRALREIGLGRPRREALEAMAERMQVPELEVFVGSLVQTEALGTTLGSVLRAQSLSLRTQRRQKAEEIATKAPVKMVFPIVLFTMPAFFIITLGPIGVRLVDYLND